MSHGNIGVFFSQCRVNDAKLKNYRKQRQWNLGLEDNKRNWHARSYDLLRGKRKLSLIFFFFAGELCCVQKIPNTQIKDPVQ